ncbi:MAG: DUF3309 domain-containing protein [Gemmatimonadaceae bacterium]|nr:DUF3309 domain-containing protein [Acetobacteraceae bacterium]
MTLVVVIVVLAILIGGGGYGWRSGYYGGNVFGGGVGLVAVVLIALLFLGKL